MSALAGFGFASPWVLFLVILLPAWWYLRRRRQPDAVTFSRTDVLARGPRSGSFITRALFVLRNLMIAGLIVALARP